MARNTKSIQPAFDDELEFEESAEEQEADKETSSTTNDIQSVDYIAELDRKQKQRKRLERIQKEITKEKASTTKTFTVNTDLLDIVLKLSDKYGYGFQKEFINSAIERELKRIGHL